MANYIVVALCTVGLLRFGYSLPTFRSKIPNGFRIPSPCNPALIWEGVGHFAMGGGGRRNNFGNDFAYHGYTWTVELCEKDSDGDGRTNGEELGDPNCVWTNGAEPETTENLSHPGFCEPHDSPLCQSNNETSVDCAATEFQCDIVDQDEDIVSYVVNLSPTPVPAEETTYMCQVLDLPTDRDYHLVAHEPYINNMNVMHHVLVYGCKDDAEIGEDQFSPNRCFMNRIEGCEDMLAVWAIGSTGTCYHEDAGFLIGLNGYKKVLIELHWNNPMLESSYTDSSGLTLYLTPNLRSNNAGMFIIGQSQLVIPPGMERYTANSTCSSECTKQSMTGNINIVAAFNHMHYLGASIVSQMVKDDGTIRNISYEEKYEYDSPKFVTFDEPIEMEPGYKLQLYCHFNSLGRSETTTYGEGANEEMCFSFIMYYPKSNWQTDDCISYGAYDSCGVPTGLSKDDCDYAALLNPQHPDTAARNARLYSSCEPGYCKDGCLDVVRGIFQEPCFKGQHLRNIKEDLRNEEYDVQTKLGIFDYFYRLDSCNAELAREQCYWGGETAGAVGLNMASFVIVAVAAIFVDVL